MLFLAPLHVLIIYGAKRFFHTLERQEAVFEEIQRRAAKAPPGQRQAVIDALKKRYDQVEAEVALVKEREEAALKAYHRKFWLIFWAIVGPAIYFLWGSDLAQWWDKL